MSYLPSIPMPFTIVALLFAVVVHEYAHGWMAYQCGDGTAKYSGRLTLNPIAHIDPFMTILMPLISYFIMGFAIGGAKPVPINPYNFRHPSRDIIKVSLAGPGSNFVLAIIFSLLARVLDMTGLRMLSIGWTVFDILSFSVFLNLLLGFFNLIPIPPLDGSKILISLLPREAAYRFESIGMFGILLVLVFVSFFWSILIFVVSAVYSLLFLGIH